MVSQFSQPYYLVILRLLLAVILGGLIGLEREFHGRPAGLRTHILVCLGAAMIMMLPEFGRARLLGSSLSGDSWIDPGRIAAGIVTGIGFLGAGTILRMGDIVRGLTTAACIWFTAVLGVMIGSGYIVIAAVSTGIGLLVLTVFERAEDWIKPTAYKALRIRVQLDKLDMLEEQSFKIFSDVELQVQDKSYSYNTEKAEAEIFFQLRIKREFDNKKVVSALAGLEGVRKIDWE
jgi:putative Mg2+ transporter-C (MgtC) family protein